MTAPVTFVRIRHYGRCGPSVNRRLPIFDCLIFDSRCGGGSPWLAAPPSLTRAQRARLQRAALLQTRALTAFCLQRSSLARGRGRYLPIARLAGLARPSVLGRPNKVIHFAGGDIMQSPGLPIVEFALQGAVQAAHG